MEKLEKAGSKAELARQLHVPVTSLKARLGSESITPAEELKQAQHIVELLHRNGIKDAALVGDIKKIRIGSHKGYIKDANKEIAYTKDLPNISLEFSPAFSEGPAWPMVVPPVIHLPNFKIIKPSKKKVLTALIGADHQIGFWLDAETGLLMPFHDARAMDLFLQVATDLQPDIIIINGDFLDNPAFQPKFRQHREFQATTQNAINIGVEHLLLLRKACPNARIVFVEGNHDARMPNYLIDNAMAAHGISRGWVEGVETPPKWPLFSVPELLRLEHLAIEYTCAFPAGKVDLTKYLSVQHQPSNIIEERATIIHSDDHKVHQVWRSIHQYGERIERGRIGTGCLCRVDDVVGHIQRRVRSNVPMNGIRPNWQQGIVVATYDEAGGPSDYDVSNVRIINGTARFRGKLYSARREIENIKWHR